MDAHAIATAGADGHRRVATADGARLAVATAGPIEDLARPLAVLAHGFPDTPATWRHLAPALVCAGHRVAMPWARGYPPSGAGHRAPHADVIGGDLVAVREALAGDGRSVVIGHDWGAVAAYSAATAGGWAAAVAVGVAPEPALRGYPLDLDQAWRSRYQVGAVLPFAAAFGRRDGLRPLIELWLRWSPGYVPTSADLRPLRASLGEPGALQAALGYYRAHAVSLLTGRYPRADGPVPPVPTLVVHGRDDGCFHERYAVRARPLLASGHPRSIVWLVGGAGHWAHLERPQEVGDAVLAFLARTTA